MRAQSVVGSGGSKWGIVSLRFVTLASLTLYLGMQLGGEGGSLTKTIGSFGSSFWVLFGVYVALNIVYAIETIEAFVSQRIAAGIFVIDVVLVCTMAYRAAAGASTEIPIEFYLAYFLAILVAATSGQATFAGGGSLVAGMVYALMATRAASFESLMKGPFWLFLTLLISTALLVAILAGGTRRQLGQKQAVRRALTVSSRLAALFDLAGATTATHASQQLDEFAREIGQEIFMARCRVFLRENPRDPETLQAHAGGISPDKAARDAGTGIIVLVSAKETKAAGEGHRSVIAAPIAYGGTTYGVLWVGRDDPAVPDLDQDDADLAESLATHVGIALHNAQMLSAVEAARQGTEDTLHQLQETQEKLLRTEKLSAVGEIVSRVAQELNTPLTNMLGTVELLQEGSPAGGRSQHLLKLVHNQTSRCRALVSSVVKAVGRQKGNRLPVDLNELVVEVINSDRERFADSGIVIEYDLSTNLPRLMVDREQIARLVSHIIDNAHRAMLRNTGTVRRLSVQSWFEGDEIRMSIGDTGPGINLDNLLSVFQPFYSGDAAIDDTRRRGLGLSAVHQIMRDHDGSVSATTNGDGGTEIFLEFPRPLAELKKGRSITARRQMARILMIDTDRALPEIVQEALLEQVKIFPVTNAQDALDLLNQESKFDGAIVDLALRGMTPEELRQGLVERSERLVGRIVWMSAGTVNEDNEEVVNNSGGTFLAKPFSLAELRAAIGSVIGRDLSPRERKIISEASTAEDFQKREAEVEDETSAAEVSAGDD